MLQKLRIPTPRPRGGLGIRSIYTSKYTFKAPESFGMSGPACAENVVVFYRGCRLGMNFFLLLSSDAHAYCTVGEAVFTLVESAFRRFTRQRKQYGGGAGEMILGVSLILQSF